ncbi:aminodeoxychorismate/anthranilate synthase component II [Bacillus sp. DX1.1]|uniref:anthranilate synthase component II n=1 Tax=unclassified Bacillus (in: firmicutes) TaxID=185979 RepID=UPI002570047E|nr:MULTISPECIES: aminodeoxychorismate/anthranilate synthase component II [unclassified Bacillus (in: firmicutes)]MDM5153877.1 aminodeoxychorismate/anthranilate synthase component II [Bacillus sp. DX1.1]WJE82812.1 aminodeoxychorismate/anthranilate synthase component II [Bacillus sp. DX3.1]
MIVLIDNYDSFTYNLYQLLGASAEQIVVLRNDKVTIKELEEMKPNAIILSPGPGKPEGAGICMEVIQHFYKTIPILGICLGHQAIVAAFGGEIVQAAHIKHGKTSLVKHNGTSIFSYVKQPLSAMRYHSLVAEQQTLPSCFDILATAMDDGEIMAVRHNYYPLFGLQFHPESIATEEGGKLIRAFLSDVKEVERV